MSSQNNSIPTASTVKAKKVPTLEELIAAGLALIAIPKGQKGPKAKGWNLIENCITRVEDVHVLSGMNVGLAHAYCSPYPTCAIDIDYFPSAIKWLDSKGINLKKHILDSGSVVFASGKRHSLKLLYRMPVGIGALESKKITVDKRTILEFRCASKQGDTVQDVLPPSQHPDGSTYCWWKSVDPKRIPTIPSEFLTLWQSLINVRQRNVSAVSINGGATNLTLNFLISPPENTPRNIATVRDALWSIPADCDRETWRNIIWAVQSTGWDCAESLAKEWSQSAPDKYDETDFYGVVNAFESLGPEGISLGTLYFHAKKQGWK